MKRQCPDAWYHVMNRGGREAKANSKREDGRDRETVWHSQIRPCEERDRRKEKKSIHDRKLRVHVENIEPIVYNSQRQT